MYGAHISSFVMGFESFVCVCVCVCVCLCVYSVCMYHVCKRGGISNRKRKGNVYFPCRKFRSRSWCFLFFDQGRVLSELIGLLLDDRELIMVVDE